MIRSITPGAGIHIAGNIYNAPYIDTTKPSAGLVRYQSGNFEVYDGYSWLPMASSYPQIELDEVTQEAVQWVKQKMTEEKHMLELALKHPAIADALAARDRAQDALKIATTLCGTK